MTKAAKGKTLAAAAITIACAAVLTAGGILRSHDVRIACLEEHAPSVEWREEVLQRLATIEALLEREGQ